MTDGGTLQEVALPPGRSGASFIIAPMMTTSHAVPNPAEQRRDLLGQRPATVWLTGLSGAGKSTLAERLETRLLASGRACYRLDGDEIRTGLNKDLGFSPADRHENIRRIAEVARLLNEAGVIAITAFISPYRADRAMAREIIGPERFLEVYLSTSLEVCEQRDVKGLYRRARSGQLPEFTGVSAPYEAPESPRLALDTGAENIETSVERLARSVEEAVLLSATTR